VPISEWLEEVQSIEVRIVPIVVMIEFALQGFGIEARPCLKAALAHACTDWSRTHRQVAGIHKARFHSDVGMRIVLAYRALQDMVYALVYGWLDLSILFTDLTNLSNLPGHVVTETEPIETAFLIQLIEFKKGALKWNLPV
jgi:hypothetical protein